MFNIKKSEKKTLSVSCLVSTLSILIGALIASLAPELYLHHFFFMFGNGLISYYCFFMEREFFIGIK